MNGQAGSTSGIDDREIEAVPLGDRAPVGHARSAQRVGADTDSGSSDGFDIDDCCQIVDVLGEEVIPPGGFRGERLRELDAPDPPEVLGQVRVGAILNSAGDVPTRRASVRRVVLEAAITGRVVGGGHDDAVTSPRVVARPSGVVRKDRVRERRCGREPVARVDHYPDPVGSEHLERGRPGRLAERVRVAGEEERTGDARTPAVVADRLSGRGDVVFVECAIERSRDVPTFRS